MSSSSKNKTLTVPDGILLGIEGGGTHTSVLLADVQGKLIARHTLGPGNFRLLKPQALKALLKACRSLASRPLAIGMGMAGIREQEDISKVRQVAQSIWPSSRLWVDHDLHSALKLAQHRFPEFPAHLMVVAGTGSCCYGRSLSGEVVKCGGWGQHLGDRGSAYDVASRAVREVIATYDRNGRWPALGDKLLQASAHNEPNDWIEWFQEADKSQIAALAMTVLSAWRSRDPLATQVIHQALDELVQDTHACANRLKVRAPMVALAGSMFTKNPSFEGRFSRRLKSLLPGVRIQSLGGDSAMGTICAAMELLGKEPVSLVNTPQARLPDKLIQFRMRPRSTALAATERRLEASMNLDRMGLSRAFDLFQEEESAVMRAIASQKTAILKCIRRVTASFKSGGRLIYVGAGTSGRLGVLDASECPPTFGVSPNQVLGVIAGGRRALWQAIEGAEDDELAGWRAMTFHKIRPNDTVMGIAASGKTPFVLGALAHAAAADAFQVMLCFNPALKWPRDHRPALVINPSTGAEILTGSTRLKAGTATKLILNMVTTLAMVGLGKVKSNLMIDVQATNEKLRDRAARMVATLSDVSVTEAHRALTKSAWNIQVACRRISRDRGSENSD
ncbi:MAG: N-acetylmuramic acid 6-phosphate etherase [Verrucomicrobia bacterium]|nr:N-acetylmuramic acid 6-phosphate etherase [Verrucomicrobiota bacterium]